MKKNLFILFFLFAISAFAEQNKIDSLFSVLKTAKEDTNKIILLNRLSVEFRGTYPDSSIYMASQAVELARKILNELPESARPNSGVNIFLASAYQNTGIGYYLKADYEKTFDYYFKALKIFEQNGNKRGMSTSYNNMGLVHWNKGDYDLAIEFFFKALKMEEERRNKSGMEAAYNNIGNVYADKGEAGADTSARSQAIKYYQQSLKICEEIGNKKGIASAYHNIGTVYANNGKYDQALEHYFKSLKIKEQIGDKLGTSTSYSTIGNSYYFQGNYYRAVEYYLKAIKIKQELSDKKGLAACYYILGRAYLKQNKIAEAKREELRSLALAREIGTKPDIMYAYLYLSTCDSAMRNFKSAYQYHQLYAEIKDSIFNENSSRQITEMQTKYESEKKQKEIELLNKEKQLQNVELEKKEAEVKKQNTQKIAFGVGFALVVLLALVIFRGLTQKQKANLLLARQKQQIEIKNTHLEKANVEITQQKKEIEEKNNEILSSIRYAQRIQEAILPPQKLVKSYLENSFILYKPKDIVAGDFYWMSPIPNPSPHGEGGAHSPSPEERGAGGETILFACCDCTGHGVPGAFVSIVAHNALNRAVKEFGLIQPSFILDKVNELVQETFSKSESDIKDGMDIALCALKMESGKWKMEYSGANNSIYFIRNGELKEIKADVQPIGKYAKNNPFTNHEVELQKGDSIYAFSDGYADQFGGPKGKKFKYSQFEKLLLSIQEKSMSEQREILNDAIDKWRGELEQIDDICIIGVRV